jgi:5-methylcytosine-specific restriction endonuclease McrA
LNSEKIKLSNKVWYEDNPEKIKKYKENTLKIDKDYYARKSREYHHRNKTKMNAKARAWRASNYEKARETERLYRFNNPQIGRLQSQKRRAFKTQNGVFEVDVNDCKKMLSQPCFYCGATASHLDHVIPLSRGGTHSKGNLVSSCSQCNLSKNNKTIMEWRVWQKRC